MTRPWVYVKREDAVGIVVKVVVSLLAVIFTAGIALIGMLYTGIRNCTIQPTPDDQEDERNRREIGKPSNLQLEEMRRLNEKYDAALVEAAHMRCVADEGYSMCGIPKDTIVLSTDGSQIHPNGSITTPDGTNREPRLVRRNFTLTKADLAHKDGKVDTDGKLFDDGSRAYLSGMVTTPGGRDRFWINHVGPGTPYGPNNPYTSI